MPILSGGVILKNTRYIPLLAVLLVLLTVLAVSCGRHSAGAVPVTNEAGETITDANGDVITVVPETEYAVVTDGNGVPVTDTNGKEVTTVIYKEVEVAIPVTDDAGKAVTDTNGEAVTEKITITPTYPAEAATKPSVSYYEGTTVVPLTDSYGQTATNTNGELVTLVQEVTLPPATIEIKPTPASWKTVFGGTHHDYFSSVAVTPDGGYVALNVTNSTDGDMLNLATDLSRPCTVAIKYNDSGKVVWSTPIAGSGALTLTDVAAGSDGSIYAAGYTNAAVEGCTPRGSYDAVLFKLSSSGDILWAKNFGSSTTDFFNGITILPDGSVVCVGSVGNNDGDVASFKRIEAGSACCIVKFSSGGSILWSNVIGGNRDRFSDVCCCSDGGFFAVGVFYTNTLFTNAGGIDAAVIKLTANGEVSWVTPIAGSGNEQFEAITASNDGSDCVIAGYSNSTDGFFSDTLASRGEQDAYIIKVSNVSHEVQWGTPFRGQYNDNFTDIICAEGGYVAVGSSNSTTRDLKAVGNRGGSDIIIACFTFGGDLSWTKGFGGKYDDSASSLCFGNGGYVIVGESYSSDNDLAGMPRSSDGTYRLGVIAKLTVS